MLHFGKRYGGDLAQQAAGNQAGNEGDTLWIPFAVYNDSGASILDTGFDRTDINIYRNGESVARAIDSGVYLGDTGLNVIANVTQANPADTGQVGDVKGLKKIGVRIINTVDDTGFYEIGSHYQVAVQGLSIAGATSAAATGHQEVNFWVATFEIDGVNTVKTTTSVQGRPQVDVREVLGDTGAAHLDGGRLGTAVTDTGIANRTWKEQASSHTGDTGSLGYGVNVHYILQDTGAAEHLGSFANNINTSGQLNAANYAPHPFGVPADVTLLNGDTGAAEHLQRHAAFQMNDTGQFDTGSFTGTAALANDTGAFINSIWAATTRGLTNSTNIDTGIRDAVWQAQNSAYTDTGSQGYGVNVHKVDNDTGAAAHLRQMADEYDTGRLPAEATATLDTGGIKDAVWQTAAGTSGAGGIGAILDTGLSDAFWKYSTSSATGDTGSVGYAQGRLMAVKGDTGAAHLDQGRLGVVSDSGKQAAVLDTGKVAAAVWTSHAARTVLDTGISAAVWAQASRTLTALGAIDTGLEGLNINLGKIRGDTGIADRIFKSLTTIVKFRASDTGTGQTTTSINSNLTEATADHYNGRVIIWTSGVLKDQATDITDYAAGTLTVTAMTEAASAGDSGIIV